MSDTFRKKTAPLTEDQKIAVLGVKELAEQVETCMVRNTTEQNAREMALAKTNLEQAIMWAVKAITK